MTLMTSYDTGCGGEAYGLDDAAREKDRKKFKDSSSQAESRSHFIYTYMYPRFTERWCNAVMFYSSLIDEGGKAPQ